MASLIDLVQPSYSNRTFMLDATRSSDLWTAAVNLIPSRRQYLSLGEVSPLKWRKKISMRKKGRRRHKVSNQTPA